MKTVQTMFVYSAIIIALLYTSKKCSAVKVVSVTGPIQHGEGPHWDSTKQVLYYVDTFSPKVLRWEAKDNKVTSHKFDGKSVGIIIPIKKRPKKFVVCRDRRVELFSWGGTCNNSGTSKELTSVDQTKPYNQFNDGKADAKGRLWAGTLTRNNDLSVSPNGGSLFKIKGDLSTAPEDVLSPLSISNGIAWSSDNTKFYHIDSETRKVVRYNFNLTEGSIESPEVVLNLEEHKHLQGIPDGMTIDRDDNLWVALFGGKSVIKIDSKTGKLLQIVKIPATYVTSVAFGGSDFDILYVTTSRLKLTAEDLKQEPSAGCVFAVYNLGVQGYRANDFEL